MLPHLLREARNARGGGCTLEGFGQPNPYPPEDCREPGCAHLLREARIARAAAARSRMQGTVRPTP